MTILFGAAILAAFVGGWWLNSQFGAAIADHIESLHIRFDDLEKHVAAIGGDVSDMVK